MKTLWISLCVTLIIAFVEAQTNLNMPKPVVTLEKRLVPPVWRRPPEERKKLSLFPRNNMKFVVTEKTTPRTEVTKPMVTTKRPLMRKLFVKDNIDKKTWSFPSQEPAMMPKQFSMPVTPNPKPDYNRSYKAKAHDQKAQSSTVKTIATSVKAENSTNNLKLNKGNLIQILNKIDAYTNKASSNNANKVIQNNDSVIAKSPVKLFNAGSTNENTAVTTLKEEVEKTREKVFMSKPVDHVMQDNKPLTASSLDTVSEAYVDENDANMTNKTNNEQVNKIAEKVLLTKQVDNVTQNNTSLNASLLYRVSEEYVDENDHESSEGNVTQMTTNEQLNKTAEKKFLSNQVNNVTQNNKSFNPSSLDTISEEYVNKNDYESSKGNVRQMTTNEQLNKTAEKKFLSNQVNNVTQNNKSLNPSSLDTISEEYVNKNDYESSEANVTQTTTNEQLNKTAEKKSLSKQVDNVIQNNKSLNASLPNTVSEEYIDENNYKNSEISLTQTTINEQINKTAEKDFISKQINNISQNDDSLKVNASDEYVVDKSDSRASHATPTELINDEEHESPVIHNTITEEPLSRNEPLEGRSLETNDLNDQNDFTISKLNDTQSSDEKSEYFSKLKELELLIKEISKGTNSYRDHKLPIHSNDAKPFSSIQDVNEENVKIQPQKFQENSNNYYEGKPIIGLDYENKISIEKNVDFAEIEATNKYDGENIGIETDHTNTESNRSSKNNTINDLENLIEVIKSNSTSSESIAHIPDSQLLKLDSKIVVEYSDKSDTISAEYDQTSPVPYLYYYDSLTKSPIEVTFDNLKMLSDSLTKSPIEITFDNLKKLSVEEKSEEPVLITSSSIVIDQNTANQTTDNAISMHNDSVTRITEKNEDGDTDIFSGIINLNIEENINHNNENSAIMDNLHDLAEIIKDKSTVDNAIEEAFSGTQLMNLDINIIEEYSHKPDEITTELDGTTQAFYLNDGSLTESPIEIIFDSQEALITGKKSIVPAFNENTHKIIEKPQINGLNKNDEIISMINDHTTEISVKIEDGSTNEVNPIEILNIEQNSSENNEHSAIVITLPNLDEVLDNNLYVGDDIEVVTNETELLNSHISIVNADVDKPHAVTVAFDETLDTKQDYIGSEHKTAPSTRILFNDREPHSMGLSSGLYTNKITNEPVTDQLNLTEEIITKVEDALKNISPKVEDADTIRQTNSLSLVDDDSNFGHNTEVAVTEKQLVTLNINITEENSDQPNMITIVMDGTTQKTYFNDEHLDHAPIGILFENLEPLSPKNEQLNVPINEISNESVTYQPSPNYDGIETTEESVNVTDKDFSDEWLGNSSHLPNDNASKSNNFKAIGIRSESNIASEETSSELIVDNSINSSDAISIESSIVTNGSSSSLEEMFEIMIAQADRTKNMADETSIESYVLNDSSSILVTQKYLSDEMIGDHTKNLTDDTSYESHVSNDSLSSLVTTEEISDKITVDNTENITDKISNESYIVNDSSSSVTTTEEIFDDITCDESENLTDEISNVSHILNDSSTTEVIIEEIFDDITDDKPECITDEVSNESRLEVIHTSDEKSEELIEQSKTITGEDASNDYVIDIRHPNTELEPNDMLVSRIKRSNNIIEEENLATTLSVFKYTGQVTRLGHDLRYKNINA